MKTLIVPCCGQLFYGNVPAYLVYNPMGDMLLTTAMKGLCLDSFDTVVVVIPTEHDKQWQAEKKILKAIKHRNVQVLQLDHETAGPANTVLEALERLHICGQIVIKDSDNYIQYIENEEGNFVVGMDVYDYAGEIRNLKNKSFLVSNEQNQLLDVVEKRICSSLVCLGAYGFADARDFIDACHALQDPIYNFDVLYVSEVITYLMGYKGLIFRYTVADDYQNWGNTSDLEDIMKCVNMNPLPKD